MADPDIASATAQPKAGEQEASDEYHGESATRVFDIPELLENILLFLGEDFYTPRKPTPECKTAIYLPVTQLFVIQRVSRTFQGTVTGSIKLRRMMFLELAPGLSVGTRSGWPPALRWFFHIAGIKTEYEDQSLLRLMDFCHHREHNSWRLSADFLKDKGYDNGSWRRIEVTFPKSLASRFLMVFVWWKSKDASGKDHLLHLIQTLGMKPGKRVLLGDVRDWLRCVDMTVEDCEVHGRGKGSIVKWIE